MRAKIAGLWVDWVGFGVWVCLGMVMGMGMGTTMGSLGSDMGTGSPRGFGWMDGWIGWDGVMIYATWLSYSSNAKPYIHWPSYLQ